MQGIEELMPIFIEDELAQIKSPFFLRRMDYFGKRLYYLVDDDLNVTFFLSNTTFIKCVLPDNKYLNDWRIDIALLKGSREEADDYVKSTADYGTCLHICIGEVVKNGKFDWSYLLEVIHDYCNNKIDVFTLRYWIRDLQKDILAFCKFVQDYNVRTLAVEFPIIGDRIATCIDLVVQMDTEVKGFWGEVYLSGAKKGMPKESKKVFRVCALLDIKSGRKGFFDAHEAQLELSKVMWNSYFSGTPYEATHIFNWSPNDWTGEEPTYKLKDQSESKFAGKTDVLFQIGEMYNVFNFSKWMVNADEEFRLGDDPLFTKKSMEQTIIEHEIKRREEDGR